MTTNRPLTFICVQPSTQYYAWQVEVMLTNFKELGLHKDYNIHCLFAFNRNESDWEKKVKTIFKVEDKFEGVADFFYYEDTREYPVSYLSSIRPNALKQHLTEYPELSNVNLFYHDCDILFTKYPDFLSKYMELDNNWYVSNTISYIGYKYIASKGLDILHRMCDIVKIHPDIVEANEAFSGGAQYIMKGVTAEFFQKVEKDSEKLFKEITEMNQSIKKANPRYHELQIWCADMWALLWNAWLQGMRTHVVKDMDFCFATDNIKRWDSVYIYHNAGVTNETKNKIFYKSDYVAKLPFNQKFEGLSSQFCGMKYAEVIKTIGENSCLL